MAINTEVDSSPQQDIRERCKALGLEKLLGDEPTGEQFREVCILLCGIPIVNEERLQKLKNVLEKVFLAIPAKRTEFPMEAGSDGTTMTKGYCFLLYGSKDEADSARLLLDGYVLDKKHTFSAYSFSALKNIQAPEKDWKPPQKEEFIDVGDLWWWLSQTPSTCQDQFAIQVEQPQTSDIFLAVYWNGRGGADPQVVNNETSNRVNWSNLPNFEWSPHGSYLVSFHQAGVKLWGGETFQPVKRYPHNNADYVRFSPNEKFLMVYSMMLRDNPDNNLKIFNVFTGEQKKNFIPPKHGDIQDYFKWASDGTYLALCRPKSNKLHVYETEQFGLIDNKPVDLPGLAAFEWNPVKNHIACYCEAQANTPAEISIIDIPSRNRIRAVRVQMVSGARIFWQKAGQYLAAYTERYTKKQRVKREEGDEIKYLGATHHVEIFDCTEKEVPVQTVQLPETFVDLGWDPRGDKFCVLVGSPKTSILIYKLDKGKPAPLLISRLEGGVNLTTVDWAPAGGWLVVHAAGSMGSCQIHFIDASSAGEASRFRVNEFPSMTRGTWDPTGRYYSAYSLSAYRYQTSRNDVRGYRIFSFQGKELVKKQIDTLLQFKWRPRPPVTLPDDMAKTVRRNMKTLSLKFEEEDRAEHLQVSKELLQERRDIYSKFAALRDVSRKQYTEEEEERRSLRHDADQASNEMVKETVISPLSSVVEPLGEE